MTELARIIGQKIKAHRRSKQISQYALGLMASVDASYIGRIEKGTVNLSVEKLISIANALKIDPRALLPDENSHD